MCSLRTCTFITVIIAIMDYLTTGADNAAIIEGLS